MSSVPVGSALSMSGYVLDSPRVGAANSPYTQTHSVIISDPVAFASAYPSNESVDRSDYVAFVLEEGDLVDAVFAWTRNQGIVRFDYDSREQRFRTLPGATPIEVGQLGSASNTERLTVIPPSLTNLGSFPIRVSVGSLPGATFSIVLVETDSSFGTPLEGHVEVSLATGHLNWNPSDLLSHSGETVHFQRQSFYTRNDSGRLGTGSECLVLNPLPATGQYPLIRVGSRQYLTPIEVMAFTTVLPGTVQWSSATGEIRVSPDSSDVYYDGVALGTLQAPSEQIGTVFTPSVVPFGVDPNRDLFFRAKSGSQVIQFAQTLYVEAFSSGQRGIVEVRNLDGAVQFSSADISVYGSWELSCVSGDIEVERGITLRLFRTPVDLSAENSSVHDVTSVYSTESAVLADPVIGVPYISLPATPLEDVPLTVTVTQGTGTFTGDLPNLLVGGTGYGFVPKFSERQLGYARRREGVVVQRPVASGVTALPDPLLLESSDVQLELQGPLGFYTDLAVGVDCLLDRQSGLVTFTRTFGEVLRTGKGSFSGTVFSDTSGFAGVTVGDFLVIRSGTGMGVYGIEAAGTNYLELDSSGVGSDVSYEVLRGTEVLADRYFSDVPQVDPHTRVRRIRRLGRSDETLVVSDRSRIEFRFNTADFSTSVSFVASSADFTSLSGYAVEVATDSGEVHFSSAVATSGVPVYLVRELVLGTDYTVVPELGFLDFSERMLASEEVLLNYAIADSSGAKTYIEERGRFLVRKELTPDRAAVTDTVSFNPLGRTVADNPAPKVFRGGRPQAGSSITIDTAASTVRFLSDSQVTDALPHGSSLSTDENIYVDYYTYEAIGGEKSLTVLQYPMATANIVISEGDSYFDLEGDRRSSFPAQSLLKLDNSDVYFVDTVQYSSLTSSTRVTLRTGQVFRSDLKNPKMLVTSGSVPFWEYFVEESAAWETIPRGGSKLQLVGDLTASYESGVVLAFDSNFVEVSGASYAADIGVTTVTFLSNLSGQCSPSDTVLYRSVRPIFPGTRAVATTRLSPVTSNPITVFRKTLGTPGEILEQGVGYRLDASGRIELTQDLQKDEAVAVFYTGTSIVPGGLSLRASYTHSVVPSDANGMPGQVLSASYSTYIPDSFYWRVEKVTNFRGELASQYAAEAKSAIPSGGPWLENTSQPKLYEQGRASVWYDEIRLENEDFVARATLKYYNDVVNLFEDLLQSMDGRVVGGVDGRFKFDGLLSNPPVSDWSGVTNQIDDRFKISDAPVKVTFTPGALPPFSIEFLGTYQPVYVASDYSRFFPTRRKLIGVASGPTGLETGATIADLGFKELRSVDLVSRRLPWAVVTHRAAVGATELHVDTTEGAEEFLRPAFKAGMPVVIQTRMGQWLLPVEGPNLAPTLTVVGLASDSITLSGGLPAEVPVGATVYHIPSYDSDFTPPPTEVYLKNYRIGFDVGVNLQEGLLTHIRPYSPYDGTVSLVPEALWIQNPSEGEVLDVLVGVNSTGTDPYRFPALDGSTSDDDGNRSLPVLSPTPDCEVTQLNLEQSALVQVELSVTPEFSGVGSLDVTRTVISNQAGSWVAPIPRIHDVVQIRSGANVPSDYRRVVAVDPYGTITVNEPFDTVDTDFNFVVSVGGATVGGTGVVGPLSRLTASGVDFVAAGIIPGHTVVFTSGLVAGERRQVVRVVSATELDIDPPSHLGSFQYRVDRSVLTFGGSGSILLTDVLPAVDGQTDALWYNDYPSKPRSILRAITALYTKCLTTRCTGMGAANGTALTDNSADFVASGVVSGDIVRIETGDLAGFYLVTGVTPTEISVSDPGFSSSLSVGYAIVSSLGVSCDSWQNLFRIQQQAQSALTIASDWHTRLIFMYYVSGDTLAYASGRSFSDYVGRLAEIHSRVGQLTDPSSGSIAVTESILTAIDRLYDKRWTWIDARINLEKGILPKKSRAVLNRLKSQTETLKQLTKLLTV